MPDDIDELDLLLGAAARRVIKDPDPAHFLDWAASAGPLLMENMAAQVDPATGPVSNFFRLLGVQIYNNMPLPDNDFRPRPLPKPERNQPCLCGSGRKYKHCCLVMEQVSGLVDSINLLAYVLDVLPRNALASLPATSVDTEALADVAIQWLDKDEVPRALALLEPWFKPDVVLGRRHLPLFDILMDVYLELNKPAKRKRLLARACAAEDKRLRATSWQRKASIDMDNGDVDEAWKSFSVAQKLDPDAPPLALLEMTLLCFSNEPEKAQARATFWLARFRRQRNVPQEIIDLLIDYAQNPMATFHAALADMQGAPEGLYESTQTLAMLLHTAPAPKQCYSLVPLDDDGEAWLKPGNTLARLEKRWAQAAESTKPMLTHLQNNDLDFWERSHQWLPELQQNPALWNSFHVLDDLVMAVDELLESGMMQDDTLLKLLEQLLERSSLVVERQLAQLPDNQRWTLPWAMLSNRPPLRLLAQQLYFTEARQGMGEAYIQQAERLLRLNPNDNHGIRYSLSTAWLARRQPEKVLALHEQYPDDFLCTLPLNTLLALYQTGRLAEAERHLQTLRTRHATALDMLLAKSPRKPPLHANGIVAGGKDEAWLYREDTLDVWKASGALAWLRAALNKM